MTDQYGKIATVAKALEEIQSRQKYRHFEFFNPYPKQQAFLELGKTKRERLLRAGNQLGKSEAGAYETALHLTGEYPKDWKGRVFTKPTRAWAAGVTGLATRDIIQKKLFGEPGVVAALGTGMVPKKSILDISLARGVTDLYDTINIQHKSGRTSVLKLKSYEMGRQKWQGDTLDFIWYDEEPEEDIYNEGTARLTGDGMEFMTFTPLDGMSAVVRRFLEEQSPDRGEIVMTIDDVTHFTDEQKAARVRGYKAYEREARRNGVPMLGSGRIFTATEEQIMEDPITDIPPEWTWLWGIDFGVGHPFAAALVLWDHEADVLHVHHVIRMKGEDNENETRPLYHAAAMKPFGYIPVAWPQDGHQAKQSLGQTMPISAIYKAHGLRMLPDHAKWPDGSNSTEAGVTEMDERMVSGRFKVSKRAVEFFEEYRQYHRKDGQIVKVFDDVLSATRVAVMAKRFGKPHAQLHKPDKSRPGKIAQGVDFDLFHT